MSVPPPGPCPFLPPAARAISAVSIREAGSDRGEEFYRLALTCAQALWLRGTPAQAVLLLNRAFSADLRGDEAVLKEWPAPYLAMRWILESRRPDQFLGNPRRHFQHLATRVSGPRREVRVWRAWACWGLARLVHPADPADERQIAEESLVEPGWAEIRDGLAGKGWPGEAERWQEAMSSRPAHELARQSQ